MAREKVTITLDREKASTARSLLGASSTSDAIDVALARVIQAERLRKDIDAYRRVPPAQGELQIALAGETSGLEDGTDWLALYPE